MFSDFFDLEQPEERMLNEAIAAYISKSYKWDYILSCLQADFPMMDNVYMRKAEQVLYNWFNPKDDGVGISEYYDEIAQIQVNWIRLFRDAESNEPENSWNRYQFIRNTDRTINGAIHCTNLRYEELSAKSTYSLYLQTINDENNIHIKDIDIFIDKDELCTTVFFSADLDSILPKNKKSQKCCLLLKDHEQTMMTCSFEYLELGKSDGHSVTKWLFKDGNTNEATDSFDLSTTDEIATEIWIESNCRDAEGKRLSSIEAEITIEYSDPHRDMFTGRLILNHNGGNIYTSTGKLVSLNYKTEEDQFESHTPVYRWGIGAFNAKLSIWDDVIKEKSISFHDKSDETLTGHEKSQEIESLIQELSLEEQIKAPHEHLYLRRFAFYPVMNEKKEVSPEIICQDDTLLLTAVKQEHIRTLGVNSLFTVSDYSLDEEAIERDVRCLIYDQTGRLLDTVKVMAIRHETDCHIIAALGNFTSFKWDKGKYRIELKYNEACIATASFEVGDRNVSGEYDADRIREHIRKTAAQSPAEDAFSKLMKMPGLEAVKETVKQMRTSAMFAKQRKAAGFPAHPMSLHASFIGNPGTGKTTVAKLLGRIFRELGLLSSGHVVEESRRTLVGRYYDSESKSIADALERAKGGILLIDDAYNLHIPGESKDPGNRILEYLLTALNDENSRDWMLILAGTDPEMTDMLNHNKSLLSNLPNTFIFKDYDEDQLMQIAQLYCKENKYILSAGAKTQLREVIRREMSVKDETFGNGRYVNSLMDRIVNIHMAGRIGRLFSADQQQLQTIEACDIPSIRKGCRSKSMEDLKELIGLEPVKRSIETHVNYVKMLNMRTKMGLDSSLPPLHMIFTGNPGTGKTTVADLLGEIYASMGVLTRGEVIYVERKDLVGQHIGETEAIVNKLLKRAKGNILFIDEAYQLYSNGDGKDYGRIAMESLLTTLSKDSTDMIVILAGYAKEMEELIKMNTGISSRFPYTFHFEDYSLDELVSIASHIATKQNYRFSPEAIERIKFLTKLEIQKEKESFGNARYIKRLITNKILPSMANRIALLEHPTEEELCIVTAEDIPLGEEEKAMIEGKGFNEKAISEALGHLDGLIGQEKVKKAIHNFVDVARYLNGNNEKFTGKGILKWNFTGSTGTGKSTVAKIMADILKAMNLLVTSEITEIKGEEIFNIPEYQCNEVLTNAMKKARYGLLLIDGDSPECRNSMNFMSSEQLRAKLTSLTVENGGAGAVIIAENEAPRQSLASNLALNGIYDYDHILIFEDYTAEELYQILEKCLDKYGAGISEEAEDILRKYICDLCNNRETGFANARTMKLLARTISQIVILRISSSDSAERIVLAEDVESFVWQKIYSKIGF